MRKIIIIASLLLFSYIKANNYCSQNTSPDKESCFALSGPNLHDDMCCYYELVETAQEEYTPKKLCRPIPYSARMAINYDIIDNKLYKVTCNSQELNETKKKEITVLQRCGEDVSDPSVKKCKEYSSYVDSCCYWNGKDTIGDNLRPYPDPQENKGQSRGCYWLGAKFDGEIYWGTMKLQCGSFYQKISLSMIALFTLFIIFN